MLDDQLKWARKEYRWQVMVETEFPLPYTLKPKQVGLKHRSIFKDEWIMMPDKDNGLTFWFFKHDHDCRAFMSYVSGYNIEQKLCSKIGE